MFTLVSKHRNSIMGVSALIILVHHYFTNIIEKPYKLGAIGVDMFMFVMGVGLYFSLYKGCRDKGFLKSLPSYFWRRFIKIFPAFAVFIIVWGMWKYSNGGFTIKDFFLNLSFTGYWTLSYGKYFNWFVSGVLFFYVLSPFIFLLMNKASNKILMSMIAFVFLSLLVFNMRKNDEGEICRTLIMVVRLIPLLFGMVYGAYCINKPTKKQGYALIGIYVSFFVLGVILYICNNLYWKDSGFTYGMPWYSFGLITPLFCIILSYAFEVISLLFKGMPVIFPFLGKMSFEIYLTHIFIIEYIMPVLKRRNELWFSEPMNFISALFLSIIFSYVLSCFSRKFSEKRNLPSIQI